MPFIVLPALKGAITRFTTKVAGLHTGYLHHSLVLNSKKREDSRRTGEVTAGAESFRDYCSWRRINHQLDV